MFNAIPGPPAHVTTLLSALRSGDACAALDLRGWDELIRAARAARLLGALAHSIRRSSIWESVPEPVRRHLDAAAVEARYCRQMTLYEMASVARELGPLGLPLVLLKGAAYLAQGLPFAEGRLPRDLDLLLPRDRLDKAEMALRSRGWLFEEKLTQYDQRYYREWSHELPPLRLPGHAFEVDLHHTILPPIGRLKPDAARLIADSVPVPGSLYRVLRPADQLLHAAVHLFQDSDCVDKLRDLVDIDGLARDFSARLGERFWRDVLESAAFHGLGRPLWYALAFSRAWLQTPVPPAAWEEAERFWPPALVRWLLQALAARVLGPVHPDAEADAARRLAASALEFRAQWLRMPPWLLAYHAASKALRSRREDSTKGAPV